MDQRSTTFERSLAIGRDYQRRTRMLILRAAMLRHQIHVKVRRQADISIGRPNPSPYLLSPQLAHGGKLKA